MKVGLSVNSFLTPDNKIDGIGTYTKNLYQALAKLPNIHVTQCAFPKPELQQNSKLDISFFSSSFKASLLQALLFNKPFKNPTEIALFHATDHHIPKFNNIPVIATLHDAVPLLQPDWARTSLRGLKNWAFRTSVQWADHIITISQAMVPDLIQAFGIPEHKISVVPHGVDEHYFLRVSESERLAVLKKYDLRTGYYLFIGTLQPRKNLERIIASHRLLPKNIRQEHPLIIVGRNGWNTESLLPEIYKLTQEKHGKWLNYVPQTDIPSLLQSACALVFPSLYEGFGMPVLEAFASKTAVITSNVSALPEVAGDAAILVNPYSIEEICAAMKNIIKNNELSENLIELGYKKAQELTWTKCALQTMNIYKKMLECG